MSRRSGIYLKVRRAKTEKIETPPLYEDNLQYDFGTIRDATDNFSDVNKLGWGGFGAVYKGRLSNGEEIAVKKKFYGDSRHGDRKFKKERLLVAKLQHRNIVRLLGFCLEGDERLLVYDFVPNASLDHFIFDPIKRTNLDWDARTKIIGGIAKGLLYLHEDSRRIIHRDLKTSNIWLDENMTAKIADFGLAKLLAIDQTQRYAGLVTGTYGYMAPEYLMQGQYSVKTDVFSFGVLLLEIVSGQKTRSFRRYLSNAWKNWRAGTASNLVDPLMRIGSMSDVIRSLHIGLLCVQENAADRPTMNSIVLMLNSHSVTLPMPSQPPFFKRTSLYPR